MKQDAIIFTRLNADQIAASLTTPYTKEELLEEYEWMLDRHHILVLARDVLDDGFAAISYVVVREMFERNYPDIKLTTERFTHVRDV